MRPLWHPLWDFFWGGFSKKGSFDNSIILCHFTGADEIRKATNTVIVHKGDEEVL